MIDTEFIKSDCRSSKMSIEAIIKSPEMLRFVLDHFKNS